MSSRAVPLSVDLLGAGVQSRYALEILRLIGREPHAGIELERFNSGEWVPGEHPVVVCHGNPTVKGVVTAALIDVGATIAPPLVHPLAFVASSANIGMGTIVNPGTIIGLDVEIGPGVMVHAGVILEHDSVVGAFANLAPGVTVCGGVHIDAAVSVYAGATIGPNVRIGAGAKVYAGAVVLDDVPAGATVLGTPAYRVDTPACGSSPSRENS